MSEQEARPNPTPEQLQIIADEINRMQTLYLDARNNAQGVFNFYLSFVTAVTGGAIFILQSSDDLGSVQTRLTMIALLFFTAIVGSVYLSAISGRYAQSSRFARMLDTLRRHYLQIVQPPLPPAYDTFIADQRPSIRRQDQAWYIWLVPTGTFELFIAFVNSTALALGVWIISGLDETSLQMRLWVMLLVFLVTLTIYNIYSRMVIQRFADHMGAEIDMGHRYELWAARQ